MDKPEKINRAKDLALFNMSRFLCYPLIPPHFFDIQITDICNLKCIMCNSSQSIGSMNYDALKGLLEQINCFSQERKIININGGEPLLHPNFKELSEYAGKSKDAFWLITNGLLIDRFFEEIIKYKLLVISIDGLKEAHNLIRGNGVFEKVTENIKKLNIFVNENNIQLNVIFNILINKYNYCDLFTLIEYLHDIYPFSGFTLLNLIQDNTNASMGLDNQLGYIEDPVRLRDEIIRVKDFYDNRSLGISYPKGYIDHLISNKKSRDWKCFAGYNRLTVVANGDVWICDTTLGNINKEKLKEIWYSRKAKVFRKKVKKCSNLCFLDCYAQAF